MAALEEHEGFMGEFLSKKRNTIEDLADVLQATYPCRAARFQFYRSIKRFCKEKGIKRRGIVSNEQLELQSLR
jgi:hypothetical protein